MHTHTKVYLYVWIGKQKYTCVCVPVCAKACACVTGKQKEDILFAGRNMNGRESLGEKRELGRPRYPPSTTAGTCETAIVRSVLYTKIKSASLLPHLYLPALGS